MKKLFANIVILLGVIATLAGIVSAIFYLGHWSNSYDSKLTEVNNKLAQLAKRQSDSDKQLDHVKEIALTAKIRAEGVKSQTAVLGKELKVDVETPFQQVVARAEEVKQNAQVTTEPKNIVGTPPIRITLNDFLFESQGCERQNIDMICRVTATNLMDEDRSVHVRGNSGTLYDHNDDAKKSSTTYFHGQQYQVVVPAKSRSNLVYKFKPIDKKAIPTSIAFVINENGDFNDLLRTWLKN